LAPSLTHGHIAHRVEYDIKEGLGVAKIKKRKKKKKKQEQEQRPYNHLTLSFRELLKRRSSL
jgi:hypothetical protein